VPPVTVAGIAGARRPCSGVYLRIVSVVFHDSGAIVRYTRRSYRMSHPATSARSTAGRMVSTGQGALRTTRSATLPMAS